MRRRGGRTTLTAAALLALGTLACGGDEPGTPSGDLEIVESTRVNYYVACGDVPLEIDGVTYYPLLPEEQTDELVEPYVEVLDEPQAATAAGSFAAAAPVTGTSAHIPAVAPPGPGDDEGTATRFSDDVVHYISDSGQEQWLSAEYREYNWVC